MHACEHVATYMHMCMHACMPACIRASIHACVRVATCMFMCMVRVTTSPSRPSLDEAQAGVRACARACVHARSLAEARAGLLPLALRTPAVAVLHPVHLATFLHFRTRLLVRGRALRRRRQEVVRLRRRRLVLLKAVVELGRSGRHLAGKRTNRRSSRSVE